VKSKREGLLFNKKTDRGL